MDILGDWTGLFASKPAPTSAPRSKVGAGLLEEAGKFTTKHHQYFFEQK
jgi:hypothetical protein